MSMLLTGAGSPGSFSPNLIPGFVAAFIPSMSLAAGNLWQDLGETLLATANNHPVRVLRDPWSGIRWTAPSDASRGLLKISGGKSWIETDGVDDNYVSSIDFAASYTLGSCLHTAGDPPLFPTLFCCRNGLDFPSIRLFSSTKWGHNNTGDLILDADYRVNGLAVTTSANNVNEVAGGVYRSIFTSSSKWCVGAFTEGLARAWPGPIYGIVAYNSVPTAENILLINTYLQGLQP